MIYLILIVIIAYVIIDLPLMNQVAAPFLAVIFIYIVVMLYNMRKEQKEANTEIKKELFEIKEILSSAGLQKDKPCIENEENAAEENSLKSESDSDSLL